MIDEFTVQLIIAGLAQANPISSFFCPSLDPEYVGLPPAVHHSVSLFAVENSYSSPFVAWDIEVMESLYRFL